MCCTNSGAYGEWEGEEPVERLTRYVYEIQYELKFRSITGEAFQDFFADVMELRYPGDFQRTRPWGNTGDRKNDGYLKSKRQLFQVYGSKALELQKTLKKINTDFLEAKPYWKLHFDMWIFVHKDVESAIASDVLKLLLELERKHSIKMSQWDKAELRRIVFALSDTDIAKLLGPPVSAQNIQNVGVKDLQPVLARIAKQNMLAEKEIKPVPAGKLAANLLSDNVAMLLRAGMGKSDLVKRCFEQHSDPTIGDRIAASFRTKYDELKAEGLAPDNIFQELTVFTTGSPFGGTPDHQAAALSVLAYLFESCDIFEPSSGWIGP